MKRWNDFLDSLATGGGAIFALMFFVILFGFVSLHVMHHPGYSEQMVTTFTGLLTGFAGALLGALTARSKPAGEVSSTTEATTQTTIVQKPIAPEMPAVQDNPMFDDNFHKAVIERLDQLVILGEKLLETGEKIMGGLTALNTVVTQLQTDLGTLQATIQAAIAALANVGDPDASVQAAATALQAVDTALESAQTSLQTAVTPAPAAQAKK